jgi:hypothetical protein
MRDPERIIHARSSDDAVRLMQSVSHDAPSAQARARTLAALGIPATVALAGKAVAATALVTTTKWLIAGAGVAVVAFGLSRGIVNSSRSSEADEGAAASKWVHDKNIRPSIVAPTRPTDTSPQAGIGSSAPRKASPPERISNPAQMIAVTPEPVHTESQLVKEVAALDVARKAALAHEPARVLALLDAYQREFPGGALGPEAQVLRIEALAGSGQMDKARALARKLLKADPTAPLADRVRAAVPEVADQERDATIIRSK